MDVEIINFNNYVLPDITVSVGTKYIMNGDNNEFFTYIEKRYNGSPTNAGVINSYVNYIIGEGLVDKSGINIHKYISKKDIQLICMDYKLYGQYSVQIVWSQGSKLLKQDPQPILIKHINTEKLALNQNSLGEIDGYWYSFDWENKSRYKPKLYAKFDGTYKDNPIEILTVSRISSKPYFANPDYSSGLQWAHIEEELSNGAINHIANGFTAGKIINCKGGVPATEELKRKYKAQIIEKLTGSSNKNKVIISFSDGLDSGDEIEVKNLEVAQLDTQLVYFSEEAEKKIYKAHSVTNPALFGEIDNSGLASHKDEQKEALKTLYRSNIKPMREIILDGLEFILKYAEPNIDIRFEDFEDLRVDDATKNNHIL